MVDDLMKRNPAPAAPPKAQPPDYQPLAGQRQRKVKNLLQGVFQTPAFRKAIGRK
jgi:hypothetical protein